LFSAGNPSHPLSAVHRMICGPDPVNTGQL
jgi:hypothetical protein